MSSDVTQVCWNRSEYASEGALYAGDRLGSACETTRRVLCQASVWTTPGDVKFDREIAKALEGHLRRPSHNPAADCEGWARSLLVSAMLPLTHYVMDAAEALSLLLRSERTIALSWFSQTRCILEAAGQICWLFEQTTGRDRHRFLSLMQRALLVQLKNDREIELHKDDRAPLDHTLAMAAHMGFEVNIDNYGIRLKEGRARFGWSDAFETLPKPSSFHEFSQPRLIRWTSWKPEDFKDVYKITSAVDHARLYPYTGLHWADDNVRVKQHLTLMGVCCSLVDISLAAVQEQFGGIEIKDIMKWSREFRRSADV